MDNIISKISQDIGKFTGELDGTNYVSEKVKFSKKIIGFYGVAGGVGTSSIITELSYIFANKGYKVLVMDGNFLNTHHNLYYDSNDKDQSLTDILEEFEKDINIQYQIIKPSKLHKNVNYCTQKIIELDHLLRIDVDFVNYQKLLKIMENYRQLYDLIFIDLNINYAPIGLEQAFIKSSELFIQVKTDNIHNILNTEHITNMLYKTAKNDIETIVVENKVESTNKELYWLPYEEDFNETYNNALLFINNGKSSIGDLYSNQLLNIYDSLVYQLA